MRLERKIFVFAYLLMLVVIFGLPFFSAEGYSILKNTTSELGAQKTPNAWVMNTIFILMGVTSVFAGWKYYHGFWFHRIALLVFGASLVFTAFFHHAPITDVSFSVPEDEWHSVFASTTGASFTLLAIATGFIRKKTLVRWLPILIGIAATGLSLLMFTLEDYTGLLQRLMFLLSFGWMIYEFNTQK